MKKCKLKSQWYLAFFLWYINFTTGPRQFQLLQKINIITNLTCIGVERTNFLHTNCMHELILHERKLRLYLTERSSLPVIARGFVGCTASAQSSPSQWPCIMRKGLLRSWTTISKISLSCVPTRMWSPRQHTLRTDSPVRNTNGKHNQKWNEITRKHESRQTFATYKRQPLLKTQQG